MIDRDLIVPYRPIADRPMQELDKIIVQACGIDRSRRHDRPVQTQQDIWREWIWACLNEAIRPLSKWEEDRLVEWSDQLTNRGWLSEKQAAVLERIYTEKT